MLCLPLHISQMLILNPKGRRADCVEFHKYIQTPPHGLLSIFPSNFSFWHTWQIAVPSSCNHTEKNPHLPLVFLLCWYLQSLSHNLREIPLSWWTHADSVNFLQLMSSMGQKFFKYFLVKPKQKSQIEQKALFRHIQSQILQIMFYPHLNSAKSHLSTYPQ